MLAKLALLGAVAAIASYVRSDGINQLKNICALADLASQQRANARFLEQESLETHPAISRPGHKDDFERAFEKIAKQRHEIQILLDQTFSPPQVDDIQRDLTKTDQTISKIKEAVNLLLESRNEEKIDEFTLALNRVTSLCQEFHAQANAIAKAFTGRIEAELVRETYQEFWLGITGYGVLLASYLLIIEPTVLVLRSQYNRLTAQSQELARLAMVAKHTSNMVIITGIDRKIAWVNEVFERATGYTLSEAIGKSPGEILQCDGTDPRTVTQIRECLDAGIGYRGEILNRTRNGRDYWADLDIQPVIVDGSITGFIAIESDVSKQIEDRNAIKLMSDRLLMITEGSSDGLWDWDVLNGGREWWSSRMFELLGFEQNEIEPGLNQLLLRVHPNHAEKFWTSVDQAFVAGRPIQDEILIQLKDGNYRWFLVRGKAFFDENEIAVRFAGMMQDINDRRLAEQRVADSKNFLSETLNSLSSPIVILDHCGVIIEVNNAWKDLIGQRDKKYDSFGIGLNYFRTLTGNDAKEGHKFEKIEDGIKAVMCHAAAQFSFQYQHTINGQEKWFVIHVTKANESDTSPIVVAHENITEIKAVQNELQQLNERWSAALEGAGDGVWDWDIARGRVLYTDRWCEIIGHVASEIGDSIDEWRSRVHPDDLGRVSIVLDRFLENKVPYYAVEHRLRCKDGSWKWILSRGKIFQRDERGRATRMVGTHSDVSERKELELKLLKNAELLAHANRSLEEAQTLGRIGSWSYSSHSNEFQLSKHAGVMLGLESASGCVGSGELLAVLDAEDGQRFMHAIGDASSSGNSFTLTIKSGHRDSYDHRFYRVEGKVNRERSFGNRSLFGTISDVTSDIRREESLRLAQQRAEEASRVKSEFLANMSHEIRTPMTAIIGFADLLADEVLSGRGIRVLQEHIATIKRNGEHLLALINDILDISKIEAGKMTVESTDTRPVAILDEILATTLPIATEKGLNLCVNYRNGIPGVIQSDPIRLRQILLNLVSNALKFTREGKVSIDVEYDQNVLRFAVADTGIGIAKDTLNRLFRAFEQADASTTRHYGGTGLGLRISKKLAEALGGDLIVESELGRGSRFTLTIPASSHVGQVDASSSPPIGNQKRFSTRAMRKDCLQGLRILLAEDGLDNQRLITAHLRKAGADVVVVENGAEVVQALAGDGLLNGPLRSSDFHLLISDMQMPVMDGYEAVRMLRSKGNTIPIIALTAHAMAGDEAKCIDAGCTAYLTKPIDREKLISTCYSLVESQRTGPEVAESKVSKGSQQESSIQMKSITSEYSEDPDMAELVEHYVQGLGSHIRDLERALDAWAVEDLSRLTHQLKGSGGSYGFPAITDYARKSEQLVKMRSDEEAIRGAVNELIDVCKAAIQGAKPASITEFHDTERS